MKFLMCFFELWVRHMCIDLCRRDRSMSEKFLDDTDICSVCEESRGEAMAECMSMDIFEDSCLESVGLYHIGDEESCKTDILII